MKISDDSSPSFGNLIRTMKEKTSARREGGGRKTLSSDSRETAPGAYERCALLLNRATSDIPLEMPIPVAADETAMPFLRLLASIVEIAHRDACRVLHGRVRAALPAPDQMQGRAGRLGEVHSAPTRFGVGDGGAGGE